MKRLIACIIVGLTNINGGGGVTKNSGLSQFWTDDFKMFENIYGKTSDRELYGATLPPSLAFGVDTSKLKILEASEKKEKLYDDEEMPATGSQAEPAYNPNYNPDYDSKYNTGYDTKYNSQHSEQYFNPNEEVKQQTGYDNKFNIKQDQYFKPSDDIKYTTGYGNQYAKQSYDNYAALLAKQQLLKSLNKEVAKPTKPYKFFSQGDFKPISQTSDPETYNYFKHLESIENQKSASFQKEGGQSFNPYTSYGGIANTENNDAYRNIHDILDAHEKSKVLKSRAKYPEKDEVKYVTYYGGATVKKPVRLILGNDISKTYSRCSRGSNGRCRKRPSSPTRGWSSRAVLRKIIHNDDQLLY